MGYLRNTHIVNDIQQCFYALLTKLTTATSPWTDWEVVYGFPEEEVFAEFDKPIIYIMSPVILNTIGQQGGSEKNHLWRIRIGAWLDRIHGGLEELNIFGSRMIDFFEDPKLCCSDTVFTIILGGTTYTNTNLGSMGIFVDGIEGPNDMNVADEKEFRHEYDVIFVA